MATATIEARAEEAEAALAGSRRITRARQAAAAETPTDYKALNKMVKRQRARLTRAKKSGDRNAVVLAVRDAVREWNQPGAIWPDCWSDWQRALDDALHWTEHIDIRDLAADLT